MTQLENMLAHGWLILPSLYEKKQTFIRMLYEKSLKF